MFFFHVGVYLFPSKLPPKIQKQLDQTLYAKYIASAVERVTGIRQPGLVAATDTLRDNVESTYGPSRIEVLAIAANANLTFVGFPGTADATLPVNDALWRFLDNCRIWPNAFFNSAWLELIAPAIFAVCRQYAELSQTARKQLTYEGLTLKHIAAWESHTRQAQQGTRRWHGPPQTTQELHDYSLSIQRLAHDIFTKKTEPERFPRSFRKVLQDIQQYDAAYRAARAARADNNPIKIIELPETQRIITIH